MSDTKKHPQTLSELIDRLDAIREDLLCLQRSLEKMEPDDAAAAITDESNFPPLAS
jgi:hypothetical protein